VAQISSPSSMVLRARTVNLLRTKLELLFLRELHNHKVRYVKTMLVNKRGFGYIG
jgi:hypothetical protein